MTIAAAGSALAFAAVAQEPPAKDPPVFLTPPAHAESGSPASGIRRSSSQAAREVQLRQEAASGTGTGSFIFQHDGQSVKVYTARPARHENGLIVLLHGATRNGPDYLKSGSVLTERMGMTLAVPEFDRARFPPEAYQEGGIFRKGRPVPKEKSTFAFIAPLIREMEKQPGVSGRPCVLVGHSAGAQFLSRLAGLAPELAAPADRIVLVNAGSLLFPDRSLPWPYGFGNLPETLSSDEVLKNYLAAPVVFYIGTGDTGSTRLPADATAMRQGPDRVARSRNCHAAGKKLAAERGWPFAWTLVEAEGLDHHSLPMWRHEKALQALSDGASN